MAGPVRSFFSDEAGAAKTQTGFAIAASVGVLAVVIYLVAAGEGRQARMAPPPSPQEIALAELLNGQIRTFNDSQTRVRFERYMDPGERTDAQLRNAHRTWARRAADPYYDDPDVAADMFKIIDTAMQLRRVRPHADI